MSKCIRKGDYEYIKKPLKPLNPVFVGKCIRKGDYNRIYKGLENGRIQFDDVFHKTVIENIRYIRRKLDKHKEWKFYCLLVDNFDDIKISKKDMCIMLNNDETYSNSTIEKYILKLDIETLNSYLEYIFNSGYFVNWLFAKMLECGANGNKHHDKCGTTYLEYAKSVSTAQLFAPYTNGINRTLFFHKIMFMIVTDLCASTTEGMVNNYFRDGDERFSITNEFIISDYLNAPNVDQNIRETEYNNVLVFLRENEIEFTTYYEDEEENEIEFATYYKEEEDPIEFTKFKWNFPEENEIREDDVVLQDEVNYWCWFDHLPQGSNLWIEKFYMLFPKRTCENCDKIIPGYSSDVLCKEHQVYILYLVLHRYQLFFPREIMLHILQYT
jgi:hypothetical protein